MRVTCPKGKLEFKYFSSLESKTKLRLATFYRDLCKRYKDLYKKRLLLDKPSDSLLKELEVNTAYLVLVMIICFSFVILLSGFLRGSMSSVCVMCSSFNYLFHLLGP